MSTRLQVLIMKQMKVSAYTSIYNIFSRAETVKELIRFLRREDDTCDIRRQLGHAQILQKDLLPLVKQHHKDKPLFDTVIRCSENLAAP